jgi:hypothetical protein
MKKIKTEVSRIRNTTSTFYFLAYFQGSVEENQTIFLVFGTTVPDNIIFASVTHSKDNYTITFMKFLAKTIVNFFKDNIKNPLTVSYGKYRVLYPFPVLLEKL